ncbi:MAG: carbon-nitrogen hydrolase family protein [Syntrophobacteraceae bacterium]|jgi:predicted amidohydrolase|nr:carbon-nitrogen hydrolase family protein [Syntrophobacteraceae bacterium]
MKDNLRVALVQPKPYPAFDDPRNLGHALQLLERCKGEPLDVVCLPEYFPYQGERELGQAARQLGAYLVAGLVEEEGGKLYNTATVFDRTGQILGRQRKRNVGSLERDQLGISPGDGFFRAFATDFGKMGVPVCIDLWGQPEAARQLVDQGAEVLFNISIFPILKAHWSTGSLVRAFDNFVPVIGVNTAEFNALIGGKRVHHHGGGSFVIQPPRLIDKDDFRRWLRSLDSIQDWIKVQLDELERVQLVDVHLATVRRFRRELWRRFGFQR